MNRTPPALARRIGRLARRAHAFHRFAHHPLCSAYAGEVVHLRRTIVCRGCLLAAAGGASGMLVALASLALPAPPAGALGMALVAATLCLLRAAAPARGAPRPSKLLTRAVPAAATAALATFGLRAGAAGVAVSAGVVAVALGATALYRRRGPDRTPCLGCPERREERVCSGFRRIARREAAFARVAARLSAAPDCTES